MRYSFPGYRLLLLLAMGIAGVASLSGRADAEKLVAALSNTSLEITSDYKGSSVAVFGTVERDAQTVPRVGAYDIVVTIRGPRQAMTIREKERFGPIWLNREQQKFPEAPAYLAVLSSRPLTEITSDALRERFKIGLDAIINSPETTNFRASRDDIPFRQALLRLKNADNLYSEKDNGVTFLTPTLYKASISVPATAPPGTYDVEVALFVDTALLDRHYVNFELIKSGFEQRVGDVAKESALLYGLTTAFLALLFGWLANVLFRRD